MYIFKTSDSSHFLGNYAGLSLQNDPFVQGHKQVCVSVHQFNGRLSLLYRFSKLVH